VIKKFYYPRRRRRRGYIILNFYTKIHVKELTLILIINCAGNIISGESQFSHVTIFLIENILICKYQVIIRKIEKRIIID